MQRIIDKESIYNATPSVQITQMYMSTYKKILNTSPRPQLHRGTGPLADGDTPL